MITETSPRVTTGPATVDRVYWRLYEHRTWHAAAYGDPQAWAVSLCGWELGRNRRIDSADRLPSSAHLCGNCARVIAARTDVEA